MSYPLTFPFLANFDQSNFKTTFLTDKVDNDQLNKFEMNLKQYFNSLLYKEFTSYIFSTVEQSFNLIYTHVVNQEEFVEKYWRSILIHDLNIDPEAKVDDRRCVDILIFLLLDSSWNEKRLQEVISVINRCREQGISVNVEKLEIFYALKEKQIDPLHFPFANFKDFLETHLTYVSHALQTSIYHLLPLTDELIQSLKFDVPQKWLEFVSTLIDDKFSTNLYDDKMIETYLFIKYIYDFCKSFLNSLNDMDFCLSSSILQTLRDFVVFVIENYKSQNLVGIIDSFSFESTLQHYVDSCCQMYPKFHIVDTHKLTDYFNTILDNSTQENHIHLALYPIWNLAIQHYSYKNDPGILYNFLDAVHYFSTIDFDIESLIAETDTYSKHYNLSEIVSKLKFWLRDILSQSKNMKETYQSKDWFFNVYVYLNNLVLNVAYDVIRVLIEPLLAELKTYDLAFVDQVKDALYATLHTYMKQKIESQLFKVIDRFLQLRKDVNIHSLDLSEGRISNVTTKLINVVNKLVDNLPSLYDLGSSNDVKILVKNNLIENLTNDKLRFDVLTERLRYFKQFDIFFNQFINAFRNKLKFTTNKFLQQIEHAFVVSFYRNTVDLDLYTYYIFLPIYSISYVYGYLARISYVLLFDPIFIERSSKLTNFGIDLRTPQSFFTSIKLKDIENLHKFL